MNADLGWRSPRLALSAAVVAFFAVVPLLGPSDYLMNLLITGLIWAVLNQSWNLVLGVAGVWNFAQLALFAIGGYVSAIITIRTGVPPVPALLAGGLAAAAASVVVGIPSLRLRGIYASLLTFSFAEVIRLLVISDDSGLTGGTFGLAPVPGLGFEDLTPDAAQRAYYWSALALCIVTAIVLYRVMHSPSGLAFQALRDAPGYAAARGISRLQFQLIAFGVSAFIAGVAGGFYAQYFHVISPSVMGLAPMTLFVTMLVVGGLGTVSGPLVGTAVILAISEYLRDHNEYRLIVLGVILLAMIVVAPRGIVPVLADARARLERWMSEEEEPGEPVPDTAVAEVGDTRARPPREQVGRKEEA